MKRNIIMFDMDMTLVDSSIGQQYGKNYKEVQKHISEFNLYEDIQEVLRKLSEQNKLYVVSGNVGSTIKKVIQYFHLNIPLENVYGYRQGYPMENLARKKKVLQVALDSVMKTKDVSKSDIIYIGDEIDDFKACQELGIRFIGSTWGNGELEKITGPITVSTPTQLLEILN